MAAGVEWGYGGALSQQIKFANNGIGSAGGSPIATTEPSSGALSTAVAQAQGLFGPGGRSESPSPVVVFVGLVVLLFLLKLLGEAPKTSIEPGHIHIGGYDVLVIGFVSVVFIAGMKLLFNKFYVPGVTNLINFV